MKLFPWRFIAFYIGWCVATSIAFDNGFVATMAMDIAGVLIFLGLVLDDDRR